MLRVIKTILLMSLAFSIEFNAFAQTTPPAITEAEIDALVNANKIPDGDSEIEALVRSALERGEMALNEAEIAIDNGVSLKESIKSEYGIDLDGPNPDAPNSSNLYIFISFSMPDDLIRQYLQDALRYNARVAIQGLIEGSMSKTTSKLASLIEEDEKGRIGIVIDPRAFEVFDVQVVPAIALSEKPLIRCETEECVLDVGKYDIIYGSVTVEYALKEFASRGETKKVATLQLGYQRK